MNSTNRTATLQPSLEDLGTPLAAVTFCVVDLETTGSGPESTITEFGAVKVRGGEILGEGWHADFGGPHAEVNAIAACGDTDLTGATMYVSLEPCCHTGKTGPCTCLLYTSPSPRDRTRSRMPSSA